MTESDSRDVVSSSYRKYKDSVAARTLYEKLDTIPIYVLTLANLFTALLTGPIRSKSKRHPSLFYHVILTAFRTMLGRMGTRQLQAANPHTDDVYKAACKKRGIEPRSEVLPDGTVAHWLGKKGASKIILNFPGGGYVVPAVPDLFEYIFQMLDIVEKEGKSVACLFLSYEYKPRAAAPYPRQLEQAALLLKHTIEELHYSPSSILLTGDSAGGNLILSLLSHLAHPHPSSKPVIPDIKLSSPLLGVALICPWVDFTTDRPSFAKSHYKDVVSNTALTRWSEAFLGGKPVDAYNQPVLAESDWWRDVGEYVEDVYIVLGGDEVMRDGILELAGKMKQGMGAGKVDTYIAEGEFHVQASMDLGFGVKLGDANEREMSRHLRGWVASKL